MPPIRRVATAVAGLAALLLAAGCSNSEAPVNKAPHTGRGVAVVKGSFQQLVVKTGGDYRFHPSTIVVHRHPGIVRIILVNTEKPGTGPQHDLVVTGLPGIAVPYVSAGHAAQDTFRVPSPGRYRFICQIHVAQGQTGVLVVKPGSAPQS